jgi:tRNA U34 5-methylaminomethyl-2-thiouridine-forming methyltransferase MnmC
LKNDSADIHLIETSDGSHSLFVPSLNETYHSRHGAIQESQWVFIKQGLDFARLTIGEKKIQELSQVTRILEVGFGTGLNALLAMRWAEKNTVHLHFTSLETNIIPFEVAQQLNYCAMNDAREAEFERVQLQKYHSQFLQMHSSPWHQDISISPYFTLHKAQREVQMESSEELYNVVFFDAFGPPAQPEMWTPSVFGRMFDALYHGGILVTYCAKGQVRRDLQSVGFSVHRLPGPPGKREMLRAIKQAHHEY